MAAELTLPRTTARNVYRAFVYREGLRKSLRRKAGIYCQVGAILLTAVFGTVAVLIHNSYYSFAQLIDQQIAGGYLRSHAGLYAAPRIIEKGARLSKDQLATSLQRAGYARDKASNIWNGSFQISESSIRILPRHGSETHQWIDIKFDDKGERIATLSADDDPDLRLYAIEPELLTVDAGLKTGQQETLTYQDIPPVLVQAILAIEDRRFFNHNGLDIRGIGRAFISWSTSGSVKFRQGGSTITQQLVKNTYLTPEKTLERKFNEAIIAVALENRLSKQDIFALYCNEVYLGQRNGVGVRGVAQAARVFFGKELKDISLGEAATIAGMIQSPARYAPDRHPDAARLRRDVVIAAMARDGAVDEDSEQTARALPVEVAPFEGSSNELAPYYIDTVNRAMDDAQRGLEPDAQQNLRVQTTIDPDLQTAAENALRHQLELLGKSARGNTGPQGAMVALDSHTGQVLAMVGGRSYAESQLNRATDAKRQPGSVFKPFVYTTALEAGISPLSTYRDAPQTFQYDHATYSPANYGRAYSMHNVVLREGLIRSLNVVTVDLAMRTGLSSVANTAARFGLPKPEAYPSMALGTSEATPLQMAAAYAAFANGGKMVQPTVIARLVDNNSGETLVEERPADRQVIKPTTAYMITDMLAEVTRRGTARRAKGSFKNVAIAGKTGTSRDGWFVGYTPNLVCAVWIGFDDNQQLGLTGAEAALPAWIDFMQEALAIRPSLGGSSFLKPGGIISVKIDPETGFLAGPTCPSSQTVNVAAQFAPYVECLEHRPVEPDLVEAYTDDLESFESSDAVAAGPLEAEEDKNLSPHAVGTHFSGAEPEKTAHSMPSQTSRELDPRGRPILVSAPGIPDPGPASNVVRVRP
jgi:penicillin-binding protein 1B